MYGGIFCSGTAWLSSAGDLCNIHYSPVDEAGRFLDLSFEIGDDLNGTLRASFIQTAMWAETPVFELHFPVSGS